MKSSLAINCSTKFGATTARRLRARSITTSPGYGRKSNQTRQRRSTSSPFTGSAIASSSNVSLQLFTISLQPVETSNFRDDSLIRMKQNLTLTITSLLSIFLMTFHMTEDVVRGFEPGGFKNVIFMVMMVVFLVGIVMLAGRRSGFIITLLFSLLGSVMPLAHMRGAGLVGGRMWNSGGRFFFVWTLIALGINGLFSVILCVRGLWRLRRTKRTATEV